MLKIIPPGCYDFGEPTVTLLSVSPKTARLEKKASIKYAFDFLDQAVAKDPPKPGEIPIFLIALGAGEVFGPNRNGDYFSKEACEKYHPTFVKHAYFFRNHRNTDPKRSYGLVKASRFNKDAARIELIVYLNGTEEAAKRNGGLAADKEVEKLNEGKDIPVSMSCKVPFDVCSGCGHESTTRSEYCDGDICIRYGGLKNNIGKTFDDGHTLCALNPICDWFDISHVGHPADRTAYVLGEIVLEKKGSGSVVSGAEIAEILGMREPVWLFEKSGNANVSNQLKALRLFAKWDQEAQFQKLGFHLEWPKIPDAAKHGEGPFRFLWGSIKYGCLVPFTVFASLFNKSASYPSPNAFLNLLKVPSCERKVQTNPYNFEHYFDLFDNYFTANQNQIGTNPDNLIKQAAVAIMEKNGISHEKLSEHYCLYKLAFLDYWRQNNTKDGYLEQIVYLFS